MPAWMAFVSKCMAHDVATERRRPRRLSWRRPAPPPGRAARDAARSAAGTAALHRHLPLLHPAGLVAQSVKATWMFATASSNAAPLLTWNWNDVSPTKPTAGTKVTVEPGSVYCTLVIGVPLSNSVPFAGSVRIVYVSGA